MASLQDDDILMDSPQQRSEATVIVGPVTPNASRDTRLESGALVPSLPFASNASGDPRFGGAIDLHRGTISIRGAPCDSSHPQYRGITESKDQ